MKETLLENEAATQIGAAAATIWEKASALIIEYTFSVIGAIVILIIGFIVAAWSNAGYSRRCRG